MQIEGGLWRLGFHAIQKLETEEGILASGREELYGCIFGRDSVITALKLLTVYEKNRNIYFLEIAKKILINLLKLQGKEVNIESGEEPGKCIHEYRPTNHEHLTQRLQPPWYVYPDAAMRNYDTVDATPLLLIALHKYYILTRDEVFLSQTIQGIELALAWILEYGDSNEDGFIDYRFHKDRQSGGLVTQSWMDSHDSVFHEDGSKVEYPIAPVEVQAYAYQALRQWGKYFEGETLGERLLRRAAELKELFNKRFILETENGFSLAFGIDGAGKPLVSARSSMGHVLWAVFEGDSILERADVPRLVWRLMKPDLLASQAGFRTLSVLSSRYHPNSYHNGSIWPHDTAMIIEGFENFGFAHEARHIKWGLLNAYRHFDTPLELFVYDGALREYCSASGQTACRMQAWSAAALLGLLASLG